MYVFSRYTLYLVEGGKICPNDVITIDRTTEKTKEKQNKMRISKKSGSRRHAPNLWPRSDRK